MKNFIFILFFLIPLFQGCALITGTTHYIANVEVENENNAAIIINNEIKGYGTASFEWPRSKADELCITVVEEGYKPQVSNYTRKEIRLGSFLFDLVFPGLPGLIVDATSGALYEPEVIKKEYNSYMYNKITKKIDNKNFLYKIRYEKIRL